MHSSHGLFKVERYGVISYFSSGNFPLVDVEHLMKVHCLLPAEGQKAMIYVIL